MLKKRVITALILVAIVLSALFFLQRTELAIIAGLFFLAAGWEWSGMMGAVSYPFRVIWLLSLAVLMCAVEYFHASLGGINWLALWWLLPAVLVPLYPRLANAWFHRPLMVILGWLLLVPSFEAVVNLQAAGAGGIEGPLALLLVLVWVWAADTGAYFTGRTLGKNKLAPSVSPGKTIEGLAGGIVLPLLVTLVIWYAASVDGSLWQWLLITLLTVLAAVLGDLFESMVKRKAGVKDSGKLLPGHGGMLDRIDSVTAALPVAVALFAAFSLLG